MLLSTFMAEIFVLEERESSCFEGELRKDCGTGLRKACLLSDGLLKTGNTGTIILFVSTLHIVLHSILKYNFCNIEV